jgi:hypothetical protein
MGKKYKIAGILLQTLLSPRGGSSTDGLDGGKVDTDFEVETAKLDAGGV